MNKNIDSSTSSASASTLSSTSSTSSTSSPTKSFLNSQRHSSTFTINDVENGKVKPEWLVNSLQVQSRFCQNQNGYDTCNKKLVKEVIESCEFSLTETKEETKGKEFWLEDRGHGFFAAAFEAFRSHFPLIWKPDHLFQMVIEGLVQHIDSNAEALRSKIATHLEEKKKINVSCDKFFKGDPKNNWPSKFQIFSEEIKKDTMPKLYETICGKPFTTTGPIEAIARNISLMSATKSYFDFSCSTCCGFPSITLDGTLDDWILLKSKIADCKDFMMEEFAKKWLPALDEVVDQCIAAYQGNVDQLFWSSMVKYYSTAGSGGSSYISGWINVFFPYLNNKENQYCQSWSDLKQKMTASVSLIKGERGLNDTQLLNSRLSGNDINCFKLTFSSAPVVWHYLSTDYNLTFKTGFVGATQDIKTGTIEPQISWAIIEKVPDLTCQKQKCWCNVCHNGGLNNDTELEEEFLME
jgi:hypothetical protein